MILLVKEFLKENQEKILHFTTNNNRFYNGTLIELGKNSVLINDRKLGDMNLLYSQILNVEPFIER